MLTHPQHGKKNMAARPWHKYSDAKPARGCAHRVKRSSRRSCGKIHHDRRKSGPSMNGTSNPDRIFLFHRHGQVRSQSPRLSDDDGPKVVDVRAGRSSDKQVANGLES